MVELEPSLIADLLRQSMVEGSAPYLTVVSASMAPLIVQGDQVRLTSIDHESLSLGDIVVLENSNELLTHRFWGRFESGDECQLITKGDRPQHFDRPHDAGKLIGLVTARKRNRELMPINTGAGAVFNRGVVLLSQIDIWLFTPPAPMVQREVRGQFTHEGIFAKSSREAIGHRALRKAIYILQEILVSISQVFAHPVEVGR